ncbi:cadherin-like beta sandwich domain-containing protein [Clostridium beijerinckii]|uniref:cadherin-like beta sandwich domain-containing protein n=1 Tax=Clostridium beijerinckii TaxID=1520 RepID=UPI0013619956|nr:cadherin-like beta sandwich domain-containing protein [Clostridium beijerinckii]MZK52798.1 cell wall-binding protein [Clostridium beijerinckii]MZK60899.1 cell wall-binding protein [Clostridium beijerinckii]MZK71105.1 cell wall-binding protein [Clostridium beijerinckii]MZK76463.1 cell wall-binding protein [Clostridium beijerinckii]MZK85956.1 cell wall-binding protein [Clostridium beijerinckii]
MNKNVKKIIIFTVISTTFYTWMPSTISIGEQCAYAYSGDEITSLDLTSEGSILSIYNSITRKGDYRVKKGDKIPVVIYSKIPSNKTSFNLSTIETKAADIRVFVGNENIKLSDIYGKINIAEGQSKTIYIRLYDSKNASDSNYSLEYELVVEREMNDEDSVIDGDTEETIDDNTITLKNYDDIYLNRLVLFDPNSNKIDFSFDKTEPVQNINVDENISYINVKAVPEQQSYKLSINDKDLDPSDDKDTRLVSLDEGKNIIKIRIINSDHKTREYYLVVTRGNSSQVVSNNNTTATNQSSQAVSCWQYRKADGTLAVGWTLIENDWYYFDTSGAMKTGWIKDSSGKWYYLRESGTMAKNTTIDGYKLGSDGTYAK